MYKSLLLRNCLAAIFIFIIMNFFKNLLKKLSHKKEITRVDQRYVERRKKDFYYLPTQFYMMQNFRGQEKRQENRNNRKFKLHFKKIIHFFFNLCQKLDQFKKSRNSKKHISKMKRRRHTLQLHNNSDFKVFHKKKLGLKCFSFQILWKSRSHILVTFPCYLKSYILRGVIHK